MSENQKQETKHTLFQTIVGALFTNWLSVLGATVATISAALIVIGFVIGVMQVHMSPYLNLFTFTLLPGVLIGGLVMIAVGFWWGHRLGEEQPTLILDMRTSRHRHLIVFFIFMSAINLLILSVGMYEGYHYTESTEFCGTLCHTVMSPEYTSYKLAPHAKVACVECHIGSGADWFVKAKISGLRQVLAVAVGSYSTPIPSPVAELRPARDTCEECHWPEVFHGKRLVVNESIGEYGSYDDPQISALMLHIGGYDKKDGEYEGIHWHIAENNRVDYQAVDPQRLQIRTVRVYQEDGSYKEFVNEDIPEPEGEVEFRTMDCIDCHNRPAHVFGTADGELDDLLISGKLDGSIDGFRDKALELLAAEYATKDEAKSKIGGGIEEFLNGYASSVTGTKVDVAGSTELIYGIYDRNIFPEMNIDWNTYPVHIGHTRSIGCFRCHDEEHETADGESISQDCDLCHELLAEEERYSTLDDNIKSYIRGAQ